MFARVLSAGLLGIDAYRIEVEVDCYGGIGQIQIVGLPDAAVREAQERVRSAIKTCSFLMPTAKKWVINLAPADTRKEGPAYDLPIAIGILASCGLVPTEYLSQIYLVGELSLDGSLRCVPGILPMAIHAKNAGVLGMIVPEQNIAEAQLVENLRIYPVSHLKQACEILKNPEQNNYLHSTAREAFVKQQKLYNYELDFNEVKGQHAAKRALEIAAAGKHNILLVGPPGSGKSMLAQRLPSIMPPLLFEEALELTKLYSVAGLFNGQSLSNTLKKNSTISNTNTNVNINKNAETSTEYPALLLERPFRSPHHSISAKGLVGGGVYPKPGEISLSHMGILFLDELTEFPRQYLDLLRQPLESDFITISRAQHTLTYPASLLLVGACNPCPCGYLNDSVKVCMCSPYDAIRYWSRLSGPFLDRIDLHIDVPRLTENELGAGIYSNAQTNNSYKDHAINSTDIKDRENTKENTKNISSIRNTKTAVKIQSSKIIEIPESSAAICLRVERAVAMQKERLGKENFIYNGKLTHKQIKQFCRVDQKSHELLVHAVCQFGLSARSYDRLLRVARTIADLEASENICYAHVAEALKYRLRTQQPSGQRITNTSI